MMAIDMTPKLNARRVLSRSGFTVFFHFIHVTMYAAAQASATKFRSTIFSLPEAFFIINTIMSDLLRLRRLAGLCETAAPADAAQIARARSLIPVLEERIDRLFGLTDQVGARLILHIFERYIDGAIRHNKITDEDLREIMRNTMDLIRLYHSGKEGRVKVMKLAAKP